MSGKARLGPRFARAFEMAFELHRNQVRKGSQVPYVSHLLAVCALVLEYGGDEDEAIAALLHDAPEDQGGRATLERIANAFGQRVAELVACCTDTYEDPKPPWRRRKEAFVANLASCPDAALRIVAADKLHNLRSMVATYRVEGERLWRRFNADRDEILWYHREVAAIVARRRLGPLADELSRTLALLEELTANRSEE